MRIQQSASEEINEHNEYVGTIDFKLAYLNLYFLHEGFIHYLQRE